MCAHVFKYIQKFDHEPFANTALRTKIMKDKTLSENEHMKAAVGKELASNLVTPATPHSNEAKVQGRLLSAKIIAAEVASVIDVLKSTLSPELKKTYSGDGEGEQNGEDGSAGGEGFVLPVKRAKLANARVGAAGLSDANDEEEDAESASSRAENLHDEDAADDGGWESGSVHEGGDAGSDGDSEGQSSGEDDDDEPRRKTSSNPAKAFASKQSGLAPDALKTGKSTFLPSLSVGFTKGDSDASDFSDGDLGDVAPKKNRRGQRARRACVSFLFFFFPFFAVVHLCFATDSAGQDLGKEIWEERQSRKESARHSGERCPRQRQRQRAHAH